MMKCTKCRKNDGEIIVQKQHQHQTNMDFLCQECASKEGITSGLSLNMKDMIKSMEPLLKNMQFQFGDHQSGTMQRENEEESEQTRTGKGKKLGVLLKYGVDINERAENGEIDPVIGRDEEVERAIQILNRRTKNNPVLIGEPGVGKTAIVEGIALRISEGKVPYKLQGKRIYSLDISSITAGTMFRGMFEERMNEILKALEKRDDLIVFIDELHTIMGAGSTMESDMDIANMLKPHLARGKIKIIGATTLEEYRKIEKDSALERRFQPVKVTEPSLATSIEILNGIKDKYEQYHGVIFDQAAVEACVYLSDRYISERYMPDKAIDLMDEVGSRINLQKVVPQEVTTQRLEELRELEDEAHFNREYEQAMKYRMEREVIEKTLEHSTQAHPHKVSVTEIQWILEKMTGIPVQSLSQDEKVSLSTLQERMKNQVIGQDLAVNEIVKAVKRNRIGIKMKKKPITFLFAGPTGVGKTELTKVLAKELFGAKENIIRLDMSEYREGHSTSKLIGSPPGYVGHEQGGGLTEKVRRNPYSIILLDEVEKAHPDVMQTFLQVFDDGRMTDSHGKTVDFSHAVIIMTSNLGATAPKKTGFTKQEHSDLYREAIHRHFAPEFINRIDAIIPFEKLSVEQLVKIVELMTRELMDQLHEKDIVLDLSQEAKEWIVNKGYDEKFGARPLSRAITTHLEDQLVDLLIERDDIQKVVVGVQGNALSFDINPI